MGSAERSEDAPEDALRFQALMLESVSDSVFVYAFDPPDSGRVIHVNRAAYESRGFTRDEIVGRPITDFIASEWRPVLAPRLGELEQLGEVVGESAHVRKDGTTFPVEVRLRLVEHEGRRIVVNTSRDISSRKRAEARLRESVHLATVLNEVNTALLMSHERKQLFHEALRHSTEALEADYSVVSLKGEPDWVIGFSYNAPLAEGTVIPAERAKAAEAIAASGEVFTTEDALNDPRLDRRYIEELGVRAFMHVPLILSDQVMGVLSFHNAAAPRPYRPAQISFARNLGAAVSLAIGNIRAFDVERESALLGKALSDVSALLLSAERIDDVLPRVLGILCQAIDSNGAILSSREAGGWRTRHTYGTGERVEAFYTDGDAYARMHVIETGEAFILKDVLSDPRVDHEVTEQLGFRSHVVYPLFSHGAVIGAISFFFDRPLSALPKTKADFLERAVYVASSAEENARLLDAEVAARAGADMQARRMAILKEAADISASALAVEELAIRIEQGVPRLLRAECAAILLEDDTGALVPVGPRSSDGVCAEPEVSTTVEVWRSGRTQVALLGDENTPEGSELVLPLYAGDRVIGVLRLVWSEPRVFAADEVAFLESFASEVAVGLRNARLFERERESARLGETLARIDQGVHSSLRIEEIVRAALADGAAAIGAESAAIDGIDEHGWVVWYDWGFEQSVVGDRYSDEQNPHGVAAVRTGETIAIEDAFADERVENETMKAYGLRSVIVAPLVVRGQPIATLYYNYHAAIQRFTAAEVDFVRKVASSLSLAIENARLYETERTIADRLQEALLSLPAELPGVDYAHAYHSATEAARVGGDFYDLFLLEHDLLAITIGDVAGKGLDAAVLTSLVKNAIRAHATEKGATPAQILRLTNEVVYRATPAESFVTVFFAVLDCRDGRVVYANAGHTTSVIVREDGRVDALPPTGPILGAFRGMEFGQGETYLDLTESLLLYTDGLTEARRGRELFGEQRLFEVLADLKDADPERTIVGLIESVLRFAGGRLRDDLAVLALRRSEIDDELPMQQKLAI